MADNKLEEVRIEFINHVNTTVISQLLDDLLRVKILSDEEVEEVNVKNKRQDQARILIDNVRRKGPKASQLFIEFLQARDTYLAEQLGLQEVPAGLLEPPKILRGHSHMTFRDSRGCTRAEPSQATSRRSRVGQAIEGNIPEENVQFLESKNGIRLCPQNVFQQIQTREGTEIYPINDPKTRTRLALIICNIKFDYLSNRSGAEVDLKQMTLLLEDLGYNVETETNLSSQGITTCLKKFAAREEHKTSDGMFVVLMSHGHLDSLCGVHSQNKQSDIFSIKTVFSTFNNINCPALRGKPKVVIIQACRGEQQGCMIEKVEDSATSAAASFQSDSHAMQLQSDAIQRVHVESDFICLYSTTPDHVSWRHPKTGSLFINQIIENIKKYAWNCNLEEVFRKVMQHFANNPCQMPSKDRTTLTKKFYLFPGH